MSDKVTTFCDTVHDKLGTLQGRMDSLKKNIGTTAHCLQDKLGEIQDKDEATKQDVTDARTSLEQCDKDKKAEQKSTIDRWIENRETEKLAARAQRAENCAGIAIGIAQASIDDAERMVLESIAARRDAQAVTAG